MRAMWAMRVMWAMQTKESDLCWGGVGTGTHQERVFTYIGSEQGQVMEGGWGENRLFWVRTAESRKGVGGWLLDAKVRVVA